MQNLKAVLRSLRVAGLTANSKKCAIGRVEVRYLGFHLGHGQVPPQIDKTAAIATCPCPKTKKEVRQFLGLAGYYRHLLPNYSDITSPLTDLIKKGAPDLVQWTEQCQRAFTQIKAALCGGPLLHSPGFSLPFVLQTDASDQGLGAELSQVVERPMLYICLKLSMRERRNTAQSRKTVWPSSGRSLLSDTTCWDGLSPSVRTMPPPMAPPHERYQCADHPLVFGFTTISISGDPQAGGADGCGGLSLQKWGGGGWQAGWLPGLSRAVGVCGKRGVV